VNGPRDRSAGLREPRAVAGLVLMVVSVSPLIEGVFLVCFAEIGIALVLAATGWWLRKSAPNHSGSEASVPRRNLLTRWLRFSAAAVPIVLIAYVLGYFAFMDRQSLTHPAGAFKRFPSSFRWAPRAWVREGCGRLRHAVGRNDHLERDIRSDGPLMVPFLSRTRAEERAAACLGVVQVVRRGVGRMRPFAGPESG
jgi:hypothetical protein